MVRRTARWIVLGAAFIAVLWISRNWVWPLITRPQVSANRARFVSSADIPTKNLVATMWVDSVKFYQDQQVQVDLTLDNHSDKNVEGLSVQFRAPEFDRIGDCWQKDRPACFDDNSVPASLPVLRAGESVHLHAALKPKHTGRFGLLAIYRWTETAPRPKKTPRQTFTRAVSLEPVEVTTYWREMATEIAGLVALPLVLAVGGGVWGWLNKSREDRRQAIEKERERAFQVWKEQLARVFEYTQQHYLHIARSILGMQTAAAEATAAKAAAPTAPAVSPHRERIIFHLAMLWIHLRDLRERKGGWFFSDKAGEDILGDGWILAANQIDAKLDRKSLDELADAIKKPVSLAKFRGYFVATHPLHATFSAAEKKCLDWFDGVAPYNDGGDSFRRCMSVLNLMRMAMRFEWDRPFFEYWYARKPKIDPVLFQTLLENLPVMAADDAEGTKALAKFEEKARFYIASVEKYLREP